MLREWARILDHPLRDYLNQTPFWRGKQHPVRPDATEIPPGEHFAALQLVKEEISGVWLIDADAKGKVPPSSQAERGKLNRIRWSRYETESYLVHPAALARFVDLQAGSGGANAVRRFLGQTFEKYAGSGLGDRIADAYIANPLAPAQIVDRYLAETKARTNIVSAILQEGGIRGMDYTRFSEVAAIMLPEEIHPEMREKLDFIQKVFGL